MITLQLWELVSLKETHNKNSRKKEKRRAKIKIKIELNTRIRMKFRRILRILVKLSSMIKDKPLMAQKIKNRCLERMLRGKAKIISRKQAIKRSWSKELRIVMEI
jgi:hypothetical protein